MAGTGSDRSTRQTGATPHPGFVRAAPPAQGPLADFDTQLMLQMAAGSREAGTLLIQRNGQQIARYLARLVRDPNVVEDLSQEVFSQALSHADQFRPTAKVSTWLYRIATNTALNYLKQASRRRTQASPVDRPLEVTDPKDPGPERRLSQDELRRHVSQAILKLPINQRVALTLYQYEEFTYEQVAAVLGVSVEAVRCLLSRARTALRRELRAFE